MCVCSEWAVVHWKGVKLCTNVFLICTFCGYICKSEEFSNEQVHLNYGHFEQLQISF